MVLCKGALRLGGGGERARGGGTTLGTKLRGPSPSGRGQRGRQSKGGGGGKGRGTILAHPGRWDAKLSAKASLIYSRRVDPLHGVALPVVLAIKTLNLETAQ